MAYCSTTASHLFDTLQTVIGLLYVSVHRRNRVHVDCPSSASTCQPLTWSNLQQKHRHIFKDRLFLGELPIPPLRAFGSSARPLVRAGLCVCECVALWAEEGDIDLAGDEHLREPKG